MRLFIATCAVVVASGVICTVHAEDKRPQKGGEGMVIAEVLGKKIKMSEKDKMTGIIFGSLLEQYAKGHKIEPTKAEIEAFVSKTEQQEIQMRKEWEQERKDIRKKLKSKALSESEKKEFTSYLEMLEKLLEVDPEMEAYENENPKEINKMEEEMAKQFVKTWKVNKALFKQYGGRVIFQQAGPEPVDAYRDFLREEERKGSFKIFDKKFEPVLWEYFTNDDMHTFISETKAQGAKIFETPWWLMDEQKQFELMNMLMGEPSNNRIKTDQQ